MDINTGRIVVATNTYTSPVSRTDVEFRWMHVIYTSTADAGNRQFRVEMLDENNNEVWDARAGAVQTASNIYDYALMQGVFRETTFVDDQLHVPYPHGLILPAGYRYKIYDANNINVGDDMVITYQTVNPHTK